MYINSQESLLITIFDADDHAIDGLVFDISTCHFDDRRLEIPSFSIYNNPSGLAATPNIH